MWNGVIDVRHLYAALRLRATVYDRYTGKSLGPRLGTGFIVGPENPDGTQRGYLVTNRHVLDPTFGSNPQPTAACESLEVSGYFQHVGDARALPYAQSFTIENPRPVFASDDADLGVLDLDLNKSLSTCGPPVKSNWFDFAALAGRQAFDDMSLTVGSSIVIPGYPAPNGVAADRPILVGGVVASDPRVDAEVGAEKFAGGVLCHAFSWGGMSGSPVLAAIQKPTWADVMGEPARLSLVGVNAGHVISNGTSGVMSHFVKSTVLINLLAGLGAVGLSAKPSVEPNGNPS
jgi:hypothetical protein